MKKIVKIIIVFVFLYIGNTTAQTGNYVFTGAEMANFSIIDLATPGTQSWATDRLATPGYFSATMGATYTSATNANNINGYVKKYGNAAFTFPIGTGTNLRTLSISAPAAATDAYATAWILGDPSGNLDPTTPNAGAHSVMSIVMASLIRAVSRVGQWDWQVGNNMGATGTGVGLTITVSIPDMTAFANAADLRLVGWNGTGWTNLSLGATASGNTVNSTLSGTMIAGITAIGIGSIDFVLPLKLENFTGFNTEYNTIINWKTASEINVEKYIIQKSSDGLNFTNAATVLARKKSEGSLYEQQLPQSTDWKYFRLKIINTDGTHSYSSVISLYSAFALNEKISIYPNPVNGQNTIFININSPYEGPASLTITNAIGQTVLTQPVQIFAGIKKIPVAVNKFSPGTYYINLITQQGHKIGTTQNCLIQKK